MNQEKLLLYIICGFISEIEAHLFAFYIVIILLLFTQFSKPICLAYHCSLFHIQNALYNHTMFAFVKVSLQSKNDILYCLYNQSIFIESMFILQFKLHCEEFQNSHLKKLRIWVKHVIRIQISVWNMNVWEGKQCQLTCLR